ncbi:MAG: hypothetical protein N3B21_05600 [Clostridia bacterium]|nr:hypothetical protein [Clostridia bacterium]
MTYREAIEDTINRCHWSERKRRRYSCKKNTHSEKCIEEENIPHKKSDVSSNGNIIHILIPAGTEINLLNLIEILSPSGISLDVKLLFLK